MQNVNGFRVWDKEEKKMYTSNIKNNLFLIDGCGNLFQRKIYTNTIKVVDPSLAKNRFILLLKLGRYDISGRSVFEGDIIRYPTGWEFVVAFGTHPAYCHGDHMDTINEGFFGVPYKGEEGKLLTTEGFCALVYEGGEVHPHDSYPLSDLEDYALIVGDVFQGYYENKKGQ